MRPVLDVEGISKTYLPPPRWLRPVIRVAAKQPVEALKPLDMRLDAGDIVGLVGPNGAGKTTLLKLLAGLLEPTAGRALINGIDVARAPLSARRHLGLVLEGDLGIYDRMTGRENLEFFGAMAGLEPRASRARADELLELFELAARDKLVFGYSSGMRMRLSIARALMANPTLIVLDEPTRSLDPVAARLVCRMLVELGRAGHAVLVANHRLDEVVATCNRVVALVDGEVRYHGATEELTDAAAGTSAVSAIVDMLETDGAPT